VRCAVAEARQWERMEWDGVGSRIPDPGAARAVEDDVLEKWVKV